MLEAYFDETGIHEGALRCIVAGYWADRSKWRRFERRWKKVLAREGVEEFHAKIFFGPAPRGSQYHGWSSTRRKQFIGDLLKIIDDCKIRAVGAGVVIADWKCLNVEQRKYLTGAVWQPKQGRFSTSGCPGKPYFLPFQDCIAKVAKKCSRDEKAHYFFDLNKQFSGYARDVYGIIKSFAHTLEYGEHLGTLAMPTGMEAVQLQAADLLCYLMKEVAETKKGGRKRQLSSYLRRITRFSPPIENSSLYHREEFRRQLGNIKPPTEWSVIE